MQKTNLLVSTSKEIERKRLIKLAADIVSISIIVAVLSIAIVISVELFRGSFLILNVNIASIQGFSALSQFLLIIWALAITVGLSFFIWFLYLEKK